MAAITPSTNLKLLMCPLELSDSNQIDFATEQAQYDYFSSLPSLEVENFTYQRKDYTIRYPACIDDILEYNYVMYQNEAYSNKWFYAYITDMTWINDHLTQITIKTDVYQTFQFDIEFMQSFVEREHVNDDTIGKHTIPENLETGDYIVKEVVNSDFGSAHPVIMVTEYCRLSGPGDTSGYHMDGDNVYSGGGTVNGIYQGCMFLLCGDDTAVRNILRAYDLESKANAIVGIFMAPDYLTGYNDGGDWYYTSWGGALAYGPFRYLNIQLPDSTQIISIGKPYNNIDGVVPKNNKLFTSPYIYLMGTNNNGQSATYQYEYFNDTEAVGYARFQTNGVICPGCSIRTIPLYYKGEGYNYSEGINLGKYPICSYSSDVYTNWLTQNSVNIGVSLATSSMQVVAGGFLAASGGGALAGAGQIASGLTGIASTLGSIYEHSLMPPQIEGNTNCGDVIYSRGRTIFSFYKMNIKKEMVNIIDSYFSMYGYKVNEVKVPNITGRLNWNFVKCIGANIHGYFPEVYVNELKNIFNAGVTIWHNPNTFLDYSQNNNIV